MKLPKRISPCPILEANVELRFSSNVPPDAVFGVIYSQFKNDYNKLDKLPILQLPEQIRAADANLRYQPHYKLTKGNMVLLIGPNVMNVGCKTEYVGWDKLYPIIEDHFSKVKSANVINKALRFGLRYINFFESDIFDKINIRLDLETLTAKPKNTYIKTSIEHNKYNNLIQISNNATTQKNGKTISGSVIDIDLSISDMKFDIIHKIPDIVNDLHKEEKIIFFSILKDSYLAELNPEY